MADSPLRADLVLEGGGVKGISLVGATVELADVGYRFERIAGSSAGSIVAACIAGLIKSGEPLSRLDDIALSLDDSKFRDRGPIERMLGFLGPVRDGVGIALHDGIFKGSYLRTWLTGTLRGLGVRTFGDLRRDDPGSSLSADEEYRLVVTASDVSRQRLVRLPWDYKLYGLDPDEQVVADAVRASSSIPFFFEPVTLRAKDGGASTLVDGGMLSNFPVDIFDRTDGTAPRWPTFGVRLSAESSDQVTAPVKGPLSTTLAVVETMMMACDARRIDDLSVTSRTIFVDTFGISPVDFAITREQQEKLLASGQTTARKFLSTWDFQAWFDSQHPAGSLPS